MNTIKPRRDHTAQRDARAERFDNFNFARFEAEEHAHGILCAIVQDTLPVQGEEQEYKDTSATHSTRIGRAIALLKGEEHRAVLRMAQENHLLVGSECPRLFDSSVARWL